MLTRHGGTFTDRQRDRLTLASRHVAVAVARATPRGSLGLQVAPHPGWVPLAGGPVRTGDAGLSPREREVLELVAGGSTDHQIAQRLGISPRTVSKHLQRIYARTGAPNRAAAVSMLPRARAR